MRIVFMGTPEISVPSLDILARGPHDLVGVVTRPDAPTGRSRRLRAPAVKVAATAHDLPVIQTDDLHDPAFHDRLAELRPDLIVVVAFRILPKAILRIPERGCINLHASLLPKYRGAAPINRAIINGDSETGVTVFQLDASVDTGGIVRQKRVDIGSDETFGGLYDRLKDIGAHEVAEALDDIAAGTAQNVAQDDSAATSAPKLTRDDARVDWSAPAETVRNLVRGTTPTPGAWTTLGGEPFRLHRVDHVPAPETTCPAGAPGEIVLRDSRTGVAVATGEGAVWLTTVQPPGKRAMAGADWARGARIESGGFFE